jgi:SAM-dependent methyltransferase
MARFIGMFSTEYFGLSSDYFVGKRCLDAGCGDTAKLLISLFRLGCRDLHGFDLGSDFLSVANESLVSRGASARLRSGSVLAIPYDRADFDFVACHGVLVHLNDLGEVERAVAELGRVTKRGGLLYTVYGVVGGIWEDCIFPAVREHYRRNETFRRVVDDISPNDFGHLVTLIERGLEVHEGRRVDLSWLRDALDTDLCVTIQNIVQAPVRLRVDEAMIRRMYKENGFVNVRRLKRYVHRKNIRRFAAPLHYEREDPLVQTIYGSGNLEFIAEKARS